MLSSDPQMDCFSEVAMSFEEAILLIQSFWSEPPFPFDSKGHEEIFRLEREFGFEFPAELRTYLASYAPDFDFPFETVGNPIYLYQTRDISSRLEGYNWDPMTLEKIDDWLPAWFLIGDEGADPIMVDLSVQGGSCPVFQALHGIGSWDFFPVAHSIPLYTVLISAQHHALTAFSKAGNAVSDDENGFNLIKPAAEWYFPFLKTLIPDLYPHWTQSFDNA
jgi:hypothetical protein